LGTLTLDTPVQYVKGVGPRRSEQLARLGIRTVEDLLLHFPRRFNLRRQAQPIETLKGDEPAATVAGVVGETEYRPYGRRPWFGAGLDDGTGWVVLKWFHGGYLQNRIKSGMHLLVSGKVSVYKETIEFVNPRYEVIWDPDGANLDADELLPVYPANAAVPSSLIGRIIQNALPAADGLFDRWFDADYLARRELMDRPAAVAAMHHPEDKDHWARARRRMAYDEFLLMQLGIAIQRSRGVHRPAWPLTGSEAIDRRIRARFPFPLTAAQDRAAAEIAADIARPRPMNRLLQGDVGSGKTVVALYAALTAVAHGKQAAVMAPTEILARQHYRKIRQYLDGSRVRTALLVGAQTPAQRKQTLDAVAAGETDLVVGTHALITPEVRFAQLALAVIDEQHKFGVAQRVGFRAKGHAPHCLVMTATPIPRTLALTVFGDLDVSTIDELPPGRGRTETRCVDRSRFDEVIAFVEQRLAAGQQAYFVYPVVNESANTQLAAAQTAFEELARDHFADYKVGLIHGQMPTDAQQEVMARFAAGDLRVLAASTVVEVGLDVPNANVMVIVNAERFGLAQLHQLRGRIGRGAEDAVCILVAAAAKNPVAAERLRVLTDTNDGFKIAEADLRLRGPGEFFGTRQHGLPELRVGDLIEDYDLLRLARRDAFAIVAEDPDLSAPEHQVLRAELAKAYGDRLALIAGV